MSIVESICQGHPHRCFRALLYVGQFEAEEQSGDKVKILHLTAVIVVRFTYFKLKLHFAHICVLSCFDNIKTN